MGHVIEGTVAYSSDLSNTSLTTLQGDDVEITIANGSVMVNNATVTNANILFAGGVIHVIDQVLNPNSNSSSSSSSNSTSSDSDSDNAFGATSSASEVPFTSGQPTPTTTVTELVTSTSQVIVSQTPNGGAGGADSDNSDSDSSSSSSEDAAWIAKPTGAMGAAALFGGAA